MLLIHFEIILIHFLIILIWEYFDVFWIHFITIKIHFRIIWIHFRIIWIHFSHFYFTFLITSLEICRTLLGYNLYILLSRYVCLLVCIVGLFNWSFCSQSFPFFHTLTQFSGYSTVSCHHNTSRYQ